MPACRFLTADLADTTDGDAVLELSASTRAAHHAEVMAEVQQVLAWCEARRPGDHGPRDEGHAWHHDLQTVVEDGGWHTVALTIIADPAWVQALAEAFFPDSG